MDRLRLKQIIFLCLAILLAFRADAVARALKPGSTIRLGVLLDVKSQETLEFVHELETELSDLLQVNYAVSIAPQHVLLCDWSVACVEGNYNRLAADPDIDIIVGIGAMNGAFLTRRASYPKPVVVLGVVDPQLQGIPVSPQQTSGVSNLTFVTMPRSLGADLAVFHRLYPYRRVAWVEDRRLMALIPPDNRLLADLTAKGITVLPVGIDTAASGADQLPDDIDAVLLGSLYRFDPDARAKLIADINARRLPTFAIMGAGELKLGALAATRPETDYPRLIRRVALNVERIVAGENAADLPLVLPREEDLFINMATARRIGFSPPWEALLEAELVDVPGAEGPVQLNLEATLLEALAANHALKAQRAAYRSSEEDVALARSRLMPQVAAGAGTRIIDTEHAIGGATERTASGTASLDQVLYSEPLLADLTVSRHNLEAALATLDKSELDTVQTAGVAYFDILMAMTTRRVRKDTLNMVRQNLRIARKRLSVGYSGAADVYRWESEEAVAKNNLVEAHTALMNAKQRLNQLLARPIAGDLAVQDVGLVDNLDGRSAQTDFRTYVDNPATMRLAADFLVLEAMTWLPDIQEIDAALAARRRALSSIKRKRYLPAVNLNAQAERAFSRTGAGAEAALPDDDAWQVGVNATWSLYPGGEISARTRQIRSDISRLEAQRADLVQNLELTLRRNVIDIAARAFNIRFSRQAAEAGAKNFELVRDAYEKGLASIVELLDAQNAAITAELSAANAVYAYLIGNLNLERAMGRFAILSPPAQRIDFFNRLVQYLAEHRQQ